MEILMFDGSDLMSIGLKELENKIDGNESYKSSCINEIYELKYEMEGL